MCNVSKVIAIIQITLKTSQKQKKYIFVMKKYKPLQNVYNPDSSSIYVLLEYTNRIHYA